MTILIPMYLTFDSCVVSRLSLFIVNIVLLYTEFLERFILFGKRILSSKLFLANFVKLSQNVDLFFTECS